MSADQGPGDGYRAELLYTNATDALLITGVRTTIVSGTTVAVVPGRSASLGYDGQGRLVSLTDMGGLTSTQWRCVKEPHFFTLRA